MVTVELKYPTTISGREIKEISVRRPKLKDLKKIRGEKDEFDATIKLVTHLTEMAPDELDELDGYDWNKLKDIVQGFLVEG